MISSQLINSNVHIYIGTICDKPSLRYNNAQQSACATVCGMSARARALDELIGGCLYTKITIMRRSGLFDNTVLLLGHSIFDCLGDLVMPSSCCIILL